MSTPLLSPTSPRATDAGGTRRWTAGTLVYSTGGLVALFCWLLWGDYAWDMRDRATNPVAQIMLRGFGSPDWLVGMLIGSVPAAISLIAVPIVATRSDRYRSRWGRRIPFLLFFTPLVALSMIGLAYAPRFGLTLHDLLGERSPGIMVCRLAVFSLFWTVFEIAVVSVKALFNALINDVVPKVVIGRFFALFRIVSLSSGIIFNFYLMGLAESHAFEIFVGLGLLYGLGFSLMCLKVKEGAYPPVAMKPPGQSFVRGIGGYFHECFTHRFYLWFFVATALGLLAQGPVNTFSIFHARSVGLSDDSYGKCLALSYSISLLASYPLGVLADRFHPVRLGIGVMAIYVVATGLSFVFARSAPSFFVAFLAHTVLSGAYLTATASIRQRLLPTEKFGQFSSAAEIVIGLCNVVMPIALGIVIESSGRDYRYAFLLGGSIAGGSAVAYGVLFWLYQKRGGDLAYTAP